MLKYYSDKTNLRCIILLKILPVYSKFNPYFQKSVEKILNSLTLRIKSWKVGQEKIKPEKTNISNHFHCLMVLAPQGGHGRCL